jgi:vancomycin resistance protein YoaR
MPRWLARALLIAAFAIPTVLVGTVAAWGVDKVVHIDQVNRNVLLAGVPVGGMTTAELDTVIGQIAADTADDLATISAPGLDIVVSHEEAGITPDVDAIKKAVFATGRESNPITSFAGWVTGMSEPVNVDPIFTIDVAKTVAMLESTPGQVKLAPVEPGFTMATGEVVLSEGEDGVYLDPVEAADALAGEVEFGSRPFAVTVPWAPMQPRFDQSDVNAAVAAAQNLIDSDLTVRINGRSAVIGRTTIRRWVESRITDAGPVPVFNEDRVNDSLHRLLDGYATPLPQPKYLVANGVVTYALDGDPARGCCGEGATEALYREAQQSGNSLIFLPTRLIEDDFGLARIKSLGVTELVSEFTTNHACCENRVENIHTIADIVRGHVIQPGERFSVNDYVGQRTVEKGFVAAGTIQQGHFKDDVGGGISQFATTLFNAAFFAGLEFNDYQSHTIYISRYPYGREATLNYPDVDLAFTNNTPYAILIWPEYTDTSITVQMFSTKYWEVEQTGQDSWRSGACTSVETFRSRTSPGGETFEDSVMARYRPGEGLDCAGNPTPRP